MTLLFLVIIYLVLCTYLIFYWYVMNVKMQKLLTAIVVVGLSLLVGGVSGQKSYNTMKSVEFCSKCHEMDYFRKSLDNEDKEVLAANHFQNNYVNQKTACYECHTDYTMFGEVNAKMGGLKHLYVHYKNAFIPDENKKKPKLYKPYDSGNCFKCHGVSKRFLASKKHNAEVKSGQKGCLVSGCHDVAHHVAE